MKIFWFAVVLMIIGAFLIVSLRDLQAFLGLVAFVSGMMALDGWYTS